MCKLQPDIEAKGATGPFFVSIGDEIKLQKFLELVPEVPRGQIFVDGYDFNAYTTAGLEKMELGQEMPKNLKMTAPDLGGIGGWWKYISNVGELSPIPPGEINGFPEGVKVLGGTFVIDDEKVVFEYRDPVPGATPDLDEVMNAI